MPTPSLTVAVRDRHALWRRFFYSLCRETCAACIRVCFFEEQVHQKLINVRFVPTPSSNRNRVEGCLLPLSGDQFNKASFHVKEKYITYRQMTSDVKREPL